MNDNLFYLLQATTFAVTNNSHLLLSCCNHGIPHFMVAAHVNCTGLLVEIRIILVKKERRRMHKNEQAYGCKEKEQRGGGTGICTEYNGQVLHRENVEDTLRTTLPSPTNTRLSMVFTFGCKGCMIIHCKFTFFFFFPFLPFLWSFVLNLQIVFYLEHNFLCAEVCEM